MSSSPQIHLVPDTIHAALSRSPLGQATLETLSSPTPNGRILELVTAPIRAETVGAMKKCLGETCEALGRRLSTSPQVVSHLCREGVTDKALAAQFRLIAVEGLAAPAGSPSLGRPEVCELIEICGGLGALAAEVDMSKYTIRAWRRDGLSGSGSRWPQVFAMVVPHLFE